MKSCRKLALWELDSSRAGKPELRLVCPFWEIDCPHREKGRRLAFCNNGPLADEIAKERKTDRKAA